ncbi:MAG: hypothetical protein KDI32_08885 [Pseudomonadales bacterium]|nr:hypothetical protein [Pseudomonadales bacterium]
MRTRVQEQIVWTLLAAMLSGPPSIAADSTSVIAGLARPLPAVTAFRELRFSSMLKEPVVVSGKLEIDAAGNMIRHVELPFVETTTITGDRVSIERDENTRVFSLRRAPELESLLAAFRALVSGDSATLDESFAVSLETGSAAANSAKDWRLDLTPKSPRLAKRIARILVTGVGAEPHCLTLQEPSHGGSVLLLGSLAAAELPKPPSRERLDALCAGG